MPRISNVYTLPSGTAAVSGATVASVPYNTFLSDLVSDLNAARPVTAGGTGATTASGARTALDVQQADATLTALAGVTTAADTLIYATGADAFATTTLTEFARSLLDDTSAAAILTTLGLTGLAPAATTPTMNGTGATGSAATYSRGDHVHPSDTGKVSKSGDTMTGDLTVTKAAPQLLLNASGTAGYLRFLSGALDQYVMGGGSAGFFVNAYNASGTYTATILSNAYGSSLLTVAGDPTNALGIATKQYADGKVSKSGDTMTGDLTISKGDADLILNSIANGAYTHFKRNGTTRWVLGIGSNDNLFLNSYDASGVYVGQPLLGVAGTSLLTVAGDPAAALGIATKQYVDAVKPKTYTSAAFAVVNGALTTLEHGLGGMPDLVQVRAVCVTAEYGYEVNDEAFISNIDGNSSDKGVSVVSTITHLKVRIAIDGILGMVQTSGNVLTLTSSKWNLKVIGIKFN